MARFVLTAELSLQAPRNVAQVVQQIQSQLNGIQVNVQVQGAKQAQRDVDQLTRSADRANDSFFRMGRTFTASIRRFSALAIATRAVSLLTNTLGSAIEEAISFQNEVVRLSQVTGNSISELSGLTNEITNLATTLGVSSDKLLSVTTILAQAGLTASDTKIALAALAQTELAPTFGNITETAEGAIAILAQFKLGAGALEAQLGSLNAVSGRFAVESGDLVEVIRRTGGVFKSAGGDLNELIALFTSVRATTRESASTIATGLRTIFTRIQRPKTIEYLKQYGVELVDLEGKFVGPFEAVKRLSEALAGLEEGDITFVQIAEQLGGFRQIGKVIPLLREFALSQEALKVAQEGTGSLARDQATAQLSLAVQITKVKEQFFALVRGFTETSTFRVMADVILKLASTFIRLAEAIQPILPIITAFAGIRLAQGIGGLIGGVLGRARGMSRGGKVLGFAKGGLVPGSGSGTADDIPAMVSSGEFVMRETAVKRIGVDNLEKMNRGGIVQNFATGGTPNQKKQNKEQDLPFKGPTEFTHIQSSSTNVPSNLQKYADQNGIGNISRLYTNMGLDLPKSWNRNWATNQQDLLGAFNNTLGSYIKNKDVFKTLKAGKKIYRFSGRGKSPAQNLLSDNYEQIRDSLSRNVLSSSGKFFDTDLDVDKVLPRLLSKSTEEVLKADDKQASALIKGFQETSAFKVQGVQGRQKITKEMRQLLPETGGDAIQKFAFGGEVGAIALKSSAPQSAKAKVTVEDILQSLASNNQLPGGTSGNQSLLGKTGDFKDSSGTKTGASKRQEAPDGLTFKQRAKNLVSRLVFGGKKSQNVTAYGAAFPSPKTSETPVEASIKESLTIAYNKIIPVAAKQLQSLVGSKVTLGSPNPSIVSSIGVDDAAGKIFEGAVSSLGAPFDSNQTKKVQDTFDFPKGIGSNLAQFADFSKLASIPTDAKKSLDGNLQDIASRKTTNFLAGQVNESQAFKNLKSRLESAKTTQVNNPKGPRVKKNFGGIIQKFAIGGRAKGIQDAPLVDDILQASGSILPRPSAAIQALINAGGGAVDVDRTLKRTIGDTAYAKAPTPEAKNASLDTYFRDEAKRLQDLKTAPITQFGKELQVAIKSRQLDARKISIISKSKRVKGAAEYLSSQFGIPVQNMIFTQGGSKQPAIDAIRTKGPRVDRVKKFSGGLIQKFAQGGTPSPLDSLQEYYTDSAPMNLGLADSKNLGKDQRQKLASNVRGLRKLRTPAPATLYSSISRVAFDKMASQVGFNKAPTIPEGTKYNDIEKILDKEAKSTVGKSFNLPGFVSTSKDYAKAKTFLDNAPRASDSWAAMLTIATKANAQGVDVEKQLSGRQLNISKQDINPRTGKMETMYMKPPSSEEEVILQPRSRFRINEARAVKLGAQKNLWATAQQFASGGVVPGVGNRDTVPAMLNEGDFVIRKSSTQNIGTDVLSSMAGYAEGGNVSKGVPALLTPGEWVFDQKQAENIGYGKLNKMNKVGRYARGGFVGVKRFFKGGQAEKDMQRAQGEIIVDVSQAEAVFTNLISQLPKSIGDVILASFKGIQSVQAGSASSFKPDAVLKDTTRGQSITKQSESGGLAASGIALQLQGKKVAATEETVAHETGHIADSALGKKGMASEQQGSFQFELVEKVKPQMEAAFKAAGVDADRIKEYLANNKELFAEFFAKASPEVRAIITSTTDAAVGMKMLADHLGEAGSTYAGLEASDLASPLSGPSSAPSSSPLNPTVTPPTPPSSPAPTPPTPSASPLSPTVTPPTPPPKPLDTTDTTQGYIKNMVQAIKEKTQTLIQSKVEESRLNSEVTKQANLITQLRAQSSSGQKVSGELHQAHVRQAELLKQQEAAIQASLKAESRLTSAQQRKEELILQARSEKQAAAESRKATLKGGVPSTFTESTVGKIEAEQDRNRKTKKPESDPKDKVADNSAQLATALAAAGTAMSYFQSEITENSSTMAIFTNNALSSIQSITLVVAALQAFGLSLGRAAIAANLESLFKAVPALGNAATQAGISTANLAAGLQAGAVATTAVVAGFNILMSTLQESARLEKERQMKLAVTSDIGSEQQKQAMDKAGKSAGSEASSGVRNTFGTIGGIIGGTIGTIVGGTAGATAGSVVPFAGTAAGAAIGGAAGGAAGAATGAGLGVLVADLLGYTEEASVLAESQNRIATAKLVADKEMAASSKAASQALKDFQDGTATAADVLKSTQGAGQAVSMQIAETKKANEAEKGLASQTSYFGAIGSTIGLSDSKETKQKKADENSKIRDAELKKAVDGYIEMNQAGTSALARANAATGQSFDDFFNTLQTTNQPLADAYASSEENLERLKKEFKNISNEAERTRKAFAAMNLGFQSVDATAAAMTVGLENYLASQQAGNVGLTQSISTLQAGLTNAAQGITTEAFQSALTDAEVALTAMGAGDKEVSKFTENMGAINKAQKFYASATQDAKENLQAEFKRGAAGQSDPKKRQEALSDAITSQLEGSGVDKEVTKRIGEALAGAKIADGDLEAIIDGNFEVLDKVLKDLGDKTFGQVSKSLEQYAKYQQQLVKLTQERIQVEGKLRDAQKSTIDATLEAAKIAQEFGGAAVTPDQNRQSIIAKANVDSQGLGVGELKTGSAKEIKDRQASIRQALSDQKNIVTQAAAGDKGAQKALQGQGGAERSANTERLKQLAQENYNTTKALIDQKREEIKLIQSKNQLEKDSMDALISGDIMKFFDSQAAIGAQAALATGDQQLISQFDTASLGAATKDLERQKEAGVQQKFGRDIGGSGGLVEGGYSAIGGRVGLSQDSIQAAAQTTPEQLQAEKEARELAGTLPENMSILEMSAQTDLDAANKQLEAAEKQLEAARGEVEKSAAGPVRPAAGLARGGTVYASRGTFVNFKPKGTDTVPAMLTPGEFVVRRQSVQRGNNLAILTAMNKGQTAPSATGAAAGMAKGGQVKYMNAGGIAPQGTNSGVSINVDVQALKSFSESLSKFNSDLAINIQNLKDTQFKISLSPTNINVNLTGTSFLEQLTGSLKQELISYVGSAISQYTVGSDGKLKKSGSTLGTGL